MLIGPGCFKGGGPLGLPSDPGHTGPGPTGPGPTRPGSRRGSHPARGPAGSHYSKHNIKYSNYKMTYVNNNVIICMKRVLSRALYIHYIALAIVFSWGE